MAEFTPINTMSVKMNVDMTSAGNIAQSGDPVSSTKAMTLPGISTSANLAGAKAVFEAFVGNIAGGSYDSLSAKRTMTGGVTA